MLSLVQPHWQMQCIEVYSTDPIYTKHGKIFQLSGSALVAASYCTATSQLQSLLCGFRDHLTGSTLNVER